MKIAILGNYAMQFLHRSLKKAFSSQGIKPDIYEAGYNTINFEIFDESSGLYMFQPQYIIWHESYIGLRDTFYNLSNNEQSHFANSQIETLNKQLIIINSRIPGVKILFPSINQSDDHIFGNFYSKIATSWHHQCIKLNWLLVELSERSDSFYVINQTPTDQQILATDWTQVVNAELHFTPDYLDWLAHSICKFIGAFQGKFIKCIIVDLDNTLWGGIIGDDGLEGIHIGALGVGKAFTRLQKWIKQLKQRGIILAVCSKNEEHIAKKPFHDHPDMVLTLDDIAVFVANWDSKADNINYIQQILNIGFDSMLFIDDNPAEREMIRRHIPGICVPELPEDPAEYLPFLINLNLFETASYSQNDESRTKQYQEEAKRAQLANSITDMDEYLVSLGMKGKIGPFEAVDYQRIAQLTQRSNQFNLRTVRYTPDDIKNIAADKNYITISVQLQDKFGNYGLICLMIIKTDSKSAFLDTWIMSCRVLKRTVENFTLNYAVVKLKEVGIEQLNGEYLPTTKNGIVANLLPDMGFAPSDSNNTYYLDITNYQPHNTKITRNEHPNK